tara:strand:- start:178 stop:522 length:345 start_codon:yes stop_codon:yes gene_type:complete
MFNCNFCEERERVSYWSSWCAECANLRRMLLIYSPDKCTDILKRTLTRDEKQINFKINQEVKKIVMKQIQETPTVEESQHESDIPPPLEPVEETVTRSKNKNKKKLVSSVSSSS